MMTRPADRDGQPLVGLFWAVLLTLAVGLAAYCLMAVLS